MASEKSSLKSTIRVSITNFWIQAVLLPVLAA
ncbi:hypothetical protein AAULR_21854 [Lacticaseibacillus rhamnosus MTCC 5462]|nr:hypothetical protein AAULR_21854 [Lacticaseibacillus rhamnosus MTCC 5462]